MANPPSTPVQSLKMSTIAPVPVSSTTPASHLDEAAFGEFPDTGISTSSVEHLINVNPDSVTAEDNTDRQLIKKPSKEMLELTPDYYHFGPSQSTDPAGRCTTTDAKGKRANTIVLAYQSIGIVFAGIGTCPLYVLSSISLDQPTQDDYLALLSIVFWTFTIISLIKYCLIILRADDHGEGGTFALYSLLCQHANICRYGRVPTKREGFEPEPNSLQDKTIKYLEKSTKLQKLLFTGTMVGVCMMMGDGIMTPAISVLSAVNGLRSASSSLSQTSIVAITAALLVVLFLLQRFGTSRVGFLFSPIVITWFVSTALIGVYNVAVHYPGVFKGLSPHYIIGFFLRRRKAGWRALAGAVLCITSSEAMYADLGHFNRLAMQMGLILMAYPSCVLTYAGQIAYLTKYPDRASNVFYDFIPRRVFWPMFIVATLAAIVASQCLISACFSLVKQSVALDLFPKVRLIHTSKQHEGQIYSPEVNYFLMILCVLVVLGFRDVNALGNAYGVTVIMVMLITTMFAGLVMVVMWNLAFPLVFFFLVVYVFIEGIYVSAVLSKVPQGGWFPFAVAILIGVIMYTWVYGRTKHHAYEKANTMSATDLGLWLAAPNIIKRVTGLCIFYSDIEDDIPPLMKHYLTNIRSLHHIVIVTTVCYTKVPVVPDDERFKFSHCGGHTYAGLYRCVALYGYAEERTVRWSDFWKKLIQNLQFYIETLNENPSFAKLQNLESNQEVAHQLEVLEAAEKECPVLVIGRTRLVTQKRGLKYWFKQVFLDILYRFLYSNSTSPARSLIKSVPPSHLVEISMLYQV